MIDFWKKLSIEKPWLIIFVSVIILAGSMTYGIGIFKDLSTSTEFTANGSESQKANQKIEEKFGAKGSTDILMFEAKDNSLGEADSEAYQTEVSRMLKPIIDDNKTVSGYINQPSSSFISKDKKATYVTVDAGGSYAENYKYLQDFQSKADQSKLKVSVGGESASVEQMTETVSQDLVRAEMITLPILLGLLLFFFGSFNSAMIPLGIALFTVGGAFAIARIVNNFIPIDTYAINVITILGLGLSIDYALLSTNRFREELAKKGSVNNAVGSVIETSGRTVFFSGVTVIACILSLLIFPLDFLHSIAIGGASAILVAMLATILILPAVLRLVGKKIDAGHLPFIPRHKTDSKLWTKVANFTTKRPVISMALALVVIAVSFIPLSKINLTETMDENYYAQGSSSMAVGKKLANDFDAQTPTIEVINYDIKNLDQADKIKYAHEFGQRLEKIDNVKQVISPIVLPSSMTIDMYAQASEAGMLPEQLKELQDKSLKAEAVKYSIVTDGPAGSDKAEVTLKSVRDLDPQYGQMLVGGQEAVNYDTSQVYKNNLPIALAVIVIAMIVLLTLSLSSVVIPLQAIVINLISIMVAFGLLVGFFQLGWFGVFAHVDGIVMTPLILVAAIAFGLAMDYSVFLYTRMYEAHEKTGKPIKAIKEGIVKTGPIITAAALMVFVVVIAFADSRVVVMQMIGLGLGLAVLIDAFFVRLLLVPSIMKLMGKSSWWAPKIIKKYRIKH